MFKNKKQSKLLVIFTVIVVVGLVVAGVRSVQKKASVHNREEFAHIFIDTATAYFEDGRRIAERWSDNSDDTDEGLSEAKEYADGLKNDQAEKLAKIYTELESDAKYGYISTENLKIYAKLEKFIANMKVYDLKNAHTVNSYNEKLRDYKNKYQEYLEFLGKITPHNNLVTKYDIEMDQTLLAQACIYYGMRHYESWNVNSTKNLTFNVIPSNVSPSFAIINNHTTKVWGVEYLEDYEIDSKDYTGYFFEIVDRTGQSMIPAKTGITPIPTEDLLKYINQNGGRKTLEKISVNIILK